MATRIELCEKINPDIIVLDIMFGLNMCLFLILSEGTGILRMKTWREKL